ncbi:MAG TPA: hypothetical protein VLN57_20930 [Xanthobacteraceae bacterium]|nr:hypothetical protein [Xanthobacteraceae bacterium]
MAIDRDEKCKHGRTKWCQDCVTESWALASADGYERGLGFSVKFLREQAGAFFSEGKDDEARMIRILSRRLEAELDNAKTAATDVRKAQGIIK